MTGRPKSPRTISPDRDLIGAFTRAIADYAISTLDADGRVLSWNLGAEIHSGWTAAEMLGQPLTRFYPDDGVEDMRRFFEDAKRNGSARTEGWRMRRDGSRLWVDLVGTTIRDASGELLGFGLVSRDITKRRAAEQALRESEERLRAVTESATDAIVSTDDAGTIVSWNAAATTLYGWSAEEALGREIELIIPERLRTDAFAALTRLTATDPERPFAEPFESWGRHRDGGEVPVEISMNSWTLDGRRHYSGIVRDIAERRETDRQLRHLADHDALTGLLNGRRFNDELERVVSETTRYRRPAAVLVLDLDGFKEINDRHGHAAGDAVIGQLGTMLGEYTRQSDVVARLGGDEFGMILLAAERPEAELVAGELVTQISAHEFVITSSTRVRLSTSIGVALFDGATELSAGELLQAADRAMYEAKSAGRNTHVVYERRRRGSSSPRRSWRDALRRALDEDRFELHGQPIVPLVPGVRPRCEVLVRLREDDGTLSTPGAFLDDAERYELIGEIDRWVLARAIAHARGWVRDGHETALSVNLAGPTVVDPSLVTDLRALLLRHPLPPGTLAIEVNETAAILNLARTSELTRELHDLGCEVVLDDFGSDLATLRHLDRLEVDVIKLDGGFVAELSDRPTDRLIVRAVVEVAHGVGAVTVAQHVDDAPTLELLRGYGLDYAQGYHLGRPEPLAGVPISGATA